MELRQSTAYHEAGHAVVGRVLGIPCGACSIVEDEDASGYSICPDPWDIISHWERLGRWHVAEYGVALRARIISFMAGAEAEAEFFGDSDGGDADDRYQVTLMLDALLPDDADLLPVEVRLRRATRGLVRRHKRTIAAVAAALLANGQLENCAVNAVMNC